MEVTEIIIAMTEQHHKEWVREVFDRASSKYGEGGCSFFEYFGERLVKLAGLKAGDKILDIATGKGAVLFPAAGILGSEGKAVGIDISPRMIEETQKRTTEGWIELIEMDAESLGFSNGSFDVVFCAFALFFLPNIDRALFECKRVLRPGGLLAVSTFSQRSALDQWVAERAEELGSSKGLATVALDSKSAMRGHLEKAGFKHVEFHEESKVFWHENAEEWWNSLWTHSIRSRLEQLPSQHLEKLKAEALLRAGTGRVSDERHVLYTLAKLGSKG